MKRSLGVIGKGGAAIDHEKISRHSQVGPTARRLTRDENSLAATKVANRSAKVALEDHVKSVGGDLNQTTAVAAHAH